jgi:hypothetical protein
MMKKKESGWLTIFDEQKIIIQKFDINVLLFTR